MVTLFLPRATDRNARLAMFVSVTMGPFMKATRLARSFAHTAFTSSYHGTELLAKRGSSAYQQCQILCAYCRLFDYLILHLCTSCVAHSEDL